MFKFKIVFSMVFLIAVLQLFSTIEIHDREPKSAVKENKVVDTLDTYVKTYYAAVDKLFVYSKPDINSKQVVYLMAYSPFIVLKTEDKYLFCQLNNGMVGWIYKDTNSFTTLDNLERSVFAVNSNSYLLDVSIKNQKLAVYKDGEILKEMICSTGKTTSLETETPLGVFKIQRRGISFFNEKYSRGGKYYLQFFANYLIHSVPVDKEGNIIMEEEEKLGELASDGCIRVSMENAKWLYDTIPMSTEVNIHF